MEFALALPLLTMLLLGIVTGGLAYSRGLSLNDAVRTSARFGATGDASNASQWATDVIAQERTAQIDDPSQTTAVCVQLWKGTAATGSAVTTRCDQGTFPGPTLSTSDASFPGVPSGGNDTTCVVRVLAARQFTITIAPFPALNGTTKRGTVTRYERSTC